jgi:hypothetical protein
MSKKTLSYKEYSQLDKDSIEDMINSLLEDYFKQYPFLTFKKMDFGNYWLEIEKEIDRYPSWGSIPENNYTSGTKIELIYDLDKLRSIGDSPEMNLWQSKLYNELEDYFSFLNFQT